MNNFIIVNITLTYIRECLKDKSMLIHSIKLFLLPSFWPGTEYTWVLIWKKRLLICFENYQGIPYFHLGRVDSGWWTLCYWWALTLHVRDGFQNKSILFTDFYLKEKNKSGLHLQQAGNTLALNPHFSVNKKLTKAPFGKMNC